MELHIALDVDGTLEGYCDGAITPQLCQRLVEKGAILWMLSGRDTQEEADKILSTFKMKQAKIILGKDYIDVKTKSLRQLKVELPSDAIIVYVGDRVDDLYVAMNAGVLYCNSTVLTEDIFEEVKWKNLKAVL